MANNSIELITKYSTKAWDKVYKSEARSSLLDAPDAQVKFTGAKTVKIAKFSATGLGNYYRPNSEVENSANDTYFGYAKGNVGLTWEEFTLRQDRSANYPVELFDNEETDGLTLGAATTEISRTILIPEVDAYCFSTIASYCSETLGNLDSTPITEKNPVAMLNKALLYFDEHEVPAEKQIIFASPNFMNKLREDSTELSRYLMQADFKGDLKFSVVSYEGRKFVMVPPNRFRTNIDLSGIGYKYGAGSKAIDFMVVATDAVIHVVKYNKIKILSGDYVLAGQNFDGYSIYARIYHDVFVPDNKRFALYTHVSETTAPTAKLEVRTTNDYVVTSITSYPGDKLAKFVTSDATETIGSAATGTLTKVTIGTKLAKGAVVYSIIDGVVAASHTLA